MEPQTAATRITGDRRIGRDYEQVRDYSQSQRLKWAVCHAWTETVASQGLFLGLRDQNYARDFLGLNVVVTDLNQNHNGDGDVYINLFESTKSTPIPSV